MDWNLFWTAVGAIGGSIGAIATFSAVVVALWQTKYNNRKKLKVTVTEKNSVVSMKDNQIFHYVGLSVINIGNTIKYDAGIVCHKLSKNRTPSTVHNIPE